MARKAVNGAHFVLFLHVCGYTGKRHLLSRCEVHFFSDSGDHVLTGFVSDDPSIINIRVAIGQQQLARPISSVTMR